MLKMVKGTFLLRFIAAVFAATPAVADVGDFSGYEIRVIRPKFMSKSGRIELGGEGLLIMNQSFIYTFMASGILDYHFSEMFALELAGAYGFSIDKEDKRILEGGEFNIKTSILRTQYIFNTGLIWTPIYGKTQLPSGDMVYFDSFLSFQGGMTGIEYTYEQCIVAPPESAGAQEESPTSKPSPKTVGYPTFSVGFGQKYFLSQSLGVRWDVRNYAFQYAKADGSCDPEAGEQGSALHNNVTVQFGASTFF